MPKHCPQSGGIIEPTIWTGKPCPNSITPFFELHNPNQTTGTMFDLALAFPQFPFDRFNNSKTPKF